MPPGPRACLALLPGRCAPRPRRDGEPGGQGVAPAPAEEEERAVRDRNLLQVQDHDQPIPWKVQFNLGNSSRPSNQCRNSIQGKHLITDDLGYVCERKDLLTNGCCDVSVPSTKQYCCDGCLANGCCSAYEHCVSCCLQPNKQLLLERFLNRAAVAFQNLFMAVEDHFELCLAKCRTSSQSLQLEKTSKCTWGRVMVEKVHRKPSTPRSVWCNDSVYSVSTRWTQVGKSEAFILAQGPVTLHISCLLGMFALFLKKYLLLILFYFLNTRQQ
ncbi:SREBP regulating gene protein isoform X3 [Marmota marmota marmota]|uniref:SREBP regulating gene protein isoform X3 n=1 Tax=Marmota marmota marmota TaxID=9994 RepID=UPI0020930902|nr:SREBP regulating gene protein isoform X3 [Marmota marmota marmota]